MRVEIPEVKRCCCCLPLRRGLIFWVYLKLAITIVIACSAVGTNVFADVHWTASNTVFLIVLMYLIITYITDFLFNVIFLVSAHRKNPVYLRVYCWYAVIMSIPEILAALALIGFGLFLVVDNQLFALYVLGPILGISTFCLLAHIVVQIYFIILVRSEIFKLENSTSFQFTNHISEAQCTATIDKI